MYHPETSLRYRITHGEAAQSSLLIPLPPGGFEELCRVLGSPCCIQEDLTQLSLNANSIQANCFNPEEQMTHSFSLSLFSPFDKHGWLRRAIGEKRDTSFQSCLEDHSEWLFSRVLYLVPTFEAELGVTCLQRWAHGSFPETMSAWQWVICWPPVTIRTIPC